MKQLLFVLTFVFGVSTLSVTDSAACGEKMLALGRGVRYSLFHPKGPAVLLLLYRSNSGLEAAIKDGGDKLDVAKTQSELATALKRKNYEWIVADKADLPIVKGTIESAPGKLAVILVSFQATRAENMKIIDGTIHPGK